MLTVLTARLLHKGTILQQTAVVLLQKKKRLSLLGSIGKIAELFEKNPSSEVFTALDPTEYWGMISVRSCFYKP